ncbi:hypothetical protein NSA50_07555 [Clostridium sp. DSM 100503]|uniref:hypothetical protein n=1 Tax=Clostridium sp. DSM 100503 TaxID=2963282 RepID=UPI002149A5A7|nr:hypothetical protein [Clostridium sp. DSM 100503]MCR1950916.1 hypothetical protein [Clostridium sp. DSM 100503]
MVNVLVLVALFLGLVLIKVGRKSMRKLITYLGLTIVIALAIYIMQEFFSDLIYGVTSAFEEF